MVEELTKYKSNAKLVLCYKKFGEAHVSHVGLGISGVYTSKSLIQHGYRAVAFPATCAKDLAGYILSKQNSRHPITHVVVMAQWIQTKDLAMLTREFPDITFALNCHSNTGFLQAEPKAITLVREAIDLETGSSNFHASANNTRLRDSLQSMYGRPITYLPNLYYLHGSEPVNKPLYRGGPLRIGAFGSHRIYKNFSCAIAAAVQIAAEEGVQTNIYINSGRHDGAGTVVYRTAKAWTDGLPNVRLKEFHWSSWPEFKRMIGSMNLLMQPSYTETFNNVTADGCAEGIPSVVSPAIEWAPNYWKAPADDASEIASVGRRLLCSHHAARDGYESLKQYVKLGVPHWERFLSCRFDGT